MRLFGPSERYAFRECVYLGIWERATQRDIMSGGELVGILKWATDHDEEHPGRKPAPVEEVEVEVEPEVEVEKTEVTDKEAEAVTETPVERTTGSDAENSTKNEKETTEK